MISILRRRRSWAILAGIAVMLAIPPLVSDTYYQNMLILVFLMAIMASSWNISGGYTGYVSLGQSAFLGIGAYVTAILANHLSISPFLAAPAGGVMVGEQTREATGADIEYEDTAPVLAKGKSAPLRAWLARSATPAPAERLLSDAPVLSLSMSPSAMIRALPRRSAALRL